jgi:CxxC motif-containing protein
MKRSFVCIVCPNGCEITAEIEDGKVLLVENAKCKRGEEYVHGEITNPMRTIASLIKIRSGELPLVSVRTNKPIPKARIPDVIAEIKKVELTAPVQIGDIVLLNVCGCNSDVIITKNVRMVPFTQSFINESPCH